MGNAPFVPRGKQGRALCFRLKQANTSRLSKKPQNRLEQKTSGRFKLAVQEGQALRMGIIGNTLIESPRTPFSANTLLWTPFGATQTRVNCPIDVFILSGSFFVFRNFFSSLIAGKKGKIAICVIRLLLGLRICYRPTVLQF